MKRVRSAGLILVFLLLLTMVSGWLVHSTNQRLLYALGQIEEKCMQQEFKAAQLEIDDLNRFYRRREHVLALFVRRDYLSTTAVSLSGLRAYAQQENLQDLKSEIGKAKAHITMIDHLFFSLI